MKFNAFVITIIFVFLSLCSRAQSTNNNSIKKGYYSIGRNAEKLNQGSGLKILQSFLPDSITKGYYSIQSNKNKPVWRYTIDTTGVIRERVKKGYYSIGKNAE